MRLRTYQNPQMQYFFRKFSYSLKSNHDSEVDHGGQTKSYKKESGEESREA